MFIPIGLDKDEVRRTPSISYGIIGINVLVFLALWLSLTSSGYSGRVEEKAKAVSRYLTDHPYLEVPSEIESRLDQEERQRLAQARQESVRAGRVPAEWQMDQQRQRLDGMVRDFIAALRDSPIARWGFVPAKPRLASAISSMFVHSGWGHLLGNMVFFYITGPFVEDAYGRFLYPLLYLFSGIVAEAVHAANNPESLVPLVGASGAIAGVMGAFLVRFARRRIVFLWMPLFPTTWLSREIRIPAFLYLPFWFLIQYGMATLAPSGAGVAFWAHVGGFVFGVATALIVKVTGLERRFIEPAIEAQIGMPPNEELIRAIEEGSRGNVEEARRATQRALARDPKSIDARRYAYEMALETKDSKDIGGQATRLLELYLDQGQTDLARQFIDETTQNALSAMPPRFLMRAGGFLALQGDARGALAVYSRLVEGYPGDPAVLRALLQIAQLQLQAGEWTRAEEALQRARSHPAYSGDWIPMFEEKLRQVRQQEASAPAAGGYRGTRGPP